MPTTWQVWAKTTNGLPVSFTSNETQGERMVPYGGSYARQYASRQEAKRTIVRLRPRWPGVRRAEVKLAL